MTYFFHFLISLASAAVWALLSLPVIAQTVAPGAVQMEVYKPLQAAQEALKISQPQQALTLAKEALSVSKITPYETYLVQRTLAVAALAAKDFDQATASLEVLLLQPGLSAAEQRPLLESLMSASQQKNDSAGLVKWARRYLDDGGTNPAVRPILIQTLSLLNAHQDVVQEIHIKMKLDAAAGQNAIEAELRLLAVSYRELKDTAGYEATLHQLLALHPSKAYWAEAIGRQLSLAQTNARFDLDVYRLSEETGTLEEAAEYVMMAELALRAGLPADAQRVMENGFKNGVLGKGDQASAHAKLRQLATAKLAEDDKLMVSLEKSAKDSNAWVGLGDVWISKQQWAQASAMYAKALAAGPVRREAEVYLHHAIALFKAGDAVASRALLAKISGDKTAMAVANLWRIRMLSK
jgi:tetratricopeptide (TPR) repeat protein